MRVLFAGTPDIAVPSLRAIAEAFPVCGVLTTPDRAAGRGRQPAHSPVKSAALELGLPVLQLRTLGREAREEVADLSPDVLAVVAYGRIFGPKFLDLFPKGGINLHPSLLPRFRGPSPIPAVILAGDRETGFTVQRIAPGVDEGDILVQERIAMTGRETTGSLTALAAERGAALMRDALAAIEAGTERPVPQAGDPVYCGMIDKEDGHIDWTMPAERIERMVRAFDPWPRAWTGWNGTVLLILEAEARADGDRPPSVFEDGNGAAEPGTVLGMDKKAGILVQTGKGVLALRRLQLQAKKPLDYHSFLNGTRGFLGSILGGPE